MAAMKITPKDIYDIGQNLAREFGTEEPSFSFHRKLYSPYIHGRRDVYELLNGGALVSLQFFLVADDAALGNFTQAIQNSIPGALISTDTRYELVDRTSVPVREIRVRCHVE
jgi:hypothetical protein